MNTLKNRASTQGVFARAIVCGATSALAVWVAWFVTHLPWVKMPESAALPAIVMVWLIAAAGAGTWTGGSRRGVVGLVGGILCALIGLLILGGTRSGRPPALLIVPGFLVFGAIVGGIGGLISRRNDRPVRPLSQFATVVAVGVTPLLFVGGLVTSTGSGMAVPDWPNTFGSNMFLYPLGPRSEPGLFLEHSHRLFGSMVGLLTLVLAIWVTIAERRRWAQVLVWIAFALVCVQGGLGGLRVLLGSAEAAADKPMWAMLHGILAQLVFGVVVALAAALTPLFTSDTRLVGTAGVRKFKVFATGLTHSLVLQLLLGAAYRHMRHGHILWTHLAFSVVVVGFAVMAGAVAISLTRNEAEEGAQVGVAAGVPSLTKTLRRIGVGLIVVVGLQFVLGWAAFLAGGEGRTAQGAVEAVVRTAHQANGAVLIALAALAFVWSRWVQKRAAAAAAVAG